MGKHAGHVQEEVKSESRLKALIGRRLLSDDVTLFPHTIPLAKQGEKNDDVIMSLS